jgi:putative ABC transport system ATP-binding protein
MDTPSFAGPALVARDIHKSFRTGRRSSPILQGISLEVRRGETVFLVGPSGSGKTTLLSVLGCLLTPDQGVVQVLGQEVARLSPPQLTAFRRQYLSFIFQTFNLFPTLSVLDNIRLALSMRGESLKAATPRARCLLDQVGLGHRLHRRPAQLSTGESQRVAVARALAMNPQILFADEPTAALDAENGQVILCLLRQLVHSRGATLVVVTHDDRIFGYADRLLRLEDGRITDAPGSTRPGPPEVGPAAPRRPSLQEQIA